MARTKLHPRLCKICNSTFMGFNSDTMCSESCKEENRNRIKNVNLQETHRKCKTCNTEFCIQDFYITNKNLHTRSPHCKYCIQERNERNLLKNPKRIASSNKYKLQWSNTNPEKARDSRLKYNYGISLEDYNNMLKKQNYVCAICKKPETKKLNNGSKNLAVDHCHISNKVRGLLCFHCNSSIGKFNDDVEILQRAINYLNEVKHVETKD